MKSVTAHKPEFGHSNRAFKKHFSRRSQLLLISVIWVRVIANALKSTWHWKNIEEIYKRTGELNCKISRNFTWNCRFHGKPSISRSASRPWNREIGWALPILVWSQSRVRRNSRNRGRRDFRDFGSLSRFLTNAAISQRGAVNLCDCPRISTWLHTLINLHILTYWLKITEWQNELYVKMFTLETRQTDSNTWLHVINRTFVK